MKTYKIKSFIYFLLFAAAAFFYNEIEEKQKFQDEITTSEVANIDNEQFEEVASEDLDNPVQ